MEKKWRVPNLRKTIGLSHLEEKKMEPRLTRFAQLTAYLKNKKIQVWVEN